MLGGDVCPEHSLFRFDMSMWLKRPAALLLRLKSMPISSSVMESAAIAAEMICPVILASLIDFDQICRFNLFSRRVLNDRSKVVNASVEDLETARSEMFRQGIDRKCLKSVGAVTPIMKLGCLHIWHRSSKPI